MCRLTESSSQKWRKVYETPLNWGEKAKKEDWTYLDEEQHGSCAALADLKSVRLVSYVIIFADNDKSGSWMRKK